MNHMQSMETDREDRTVLDGRMQDSIKRVQASFLPSRYRGKLCRDLEVLFVHVPMHGQWYDYTGFTAERRQEYYENVRQIVGQYGNVQLLDLTDQEYEPYFLCDTMHLGWKGWLAVDRAIVEFYS